MPVSSFGYVTRVKTMTQPLALSRNACLPVGRGFVTVTLAVEV